METQGCNHQTSKYLNVYDKDGINIHHEDVTGWTKLAVNKKIKEIFEQNPNAVTEDVRRI